MKICKTNHFKSGHVTIRVLDLTTKHALLSLGKILSTGFFQFIYCL